VPRPFAFAKEKGAYGARHGIIKRRLLKMP
jgi:hypothetical protein